MKKLYILYILINSTFIAEAQWDPFPLGQKSFYEYPTIFNSYPTISIYHHDSIVDFGTYQVLHFNYSTPGFSGCYEAINHSSYYNSDISEYLRPDSVIKLNDSLLFAYSDPAYNPSDSILFLPKVKKGGSWFSSISKGPNADYNRLKFTCDSIYYDTIIGNIMDSIKLISVKAYNNSTPVNSAFDTLQTLLSKNNGFKQFVSFHQYFKNNIPIIGIDSGSTKEGFDLPKFSDYFHLNTGDVIFWKEEEKDIMSRKITYYKDSITSASTHTDSRIYNIQRSYHNGSQANIIKQYFKSKFQGLELSTSIFLDGETMNTGGWGNNNSLIKSSEIYITSDSIINRNILYEGLNYDTLTCRISEISDIWGETKYNTYYGLAGYSSQGPSHYTEWSIVGSVINGVQVGNINVGINELSVNHNFNISPNPSNGSSISISGKDINSIKIYSIQGKQIKTIQPTYDETAVNLENQPKGIYLVKAQFKTGEVVTKKLILTR